MLRVIVILIVTLSQYFRGNSIAIQCVLLDEYIFFLKKISSSIHPELNK